MPADFEGFRETVNDGICLETCFERITHILKKDGKFVASYSRYMRVGAKGVGEPNSDRLQERVAHEMAAGVIYVFEAVQVPKQPIFCLYGQASRPHACRSRLSATISLMGHCSTEATSKDPRSRVGRFTRGGVY